MKILSKQSLILSFQEIRNEKISWNFVNFIEQRALFAEDLQALFEQARNERQVGANSSAQTV